MQLQIDDWWEMIIAGIIIISALGIIYCIVKAFLIRGGKVKIKGAEIMGIQSLPDCPSYVLEHTQILKDLKESFDGVEKRIIASECAISDTNKITHILFRNILIAQDATLEALQKNNIGNGNIKKARELLAKSVECQEGYLIDQL